MSRREQGNRATEIARNISGVKQVIKGFQYGEMEPVEVDLPSDGVQTIESEASTESEENVEVFTISE